MPAGWIAGGIVAAGAISAYGANQAADTQAGAQLQAAGIQEGMFQQEQGNEQPFLQSGVGAQHQLNYLLGTEKPGSGLSEMQAGPAGGYGSLLTPFNASNWQQLSPGYNFQKQQGTQGVLNSDANTQGAESGAALKDLIGYNQGLANTSFGTAFNQYQTQQGNIYSRLAAIANQGQAAGSNQATGASNFGGSIGQQVAGAGASQAGGIVGGTNAISGSLNNLTAYAYLNQGGSQGTQIMSGSSGAGADGSAADYSAIYGAGA